MSGLPTSALATRASRRYWRCSPWAWGFARGKLAGDPIFAALLEPGVIPPGARVLDLGCGTGLAAAWLSAAAELQREARWPAGRPPPPAIASYHGIELRARDLRVARRALAELETASFERRDLRDAALPPADVVLLLDVMHYLDPAGQLELLCRIRPLLGSSGRLLMRVGDAGAGASYRFTLLVDRLVCFARGLGLPELHGRSLADWSTLLVEAGLEVEQRPMSRGTPFANTMLVARPGAAAGLC